jgi:hypothetical protein
MQRAPPPDGERVCEVEDVISEGISIVTFRVRETRSWKSNSQKAIFASGLMGGRGKVVIAVSGLLLSQNDGEHQNQGLSRVLPSFQRHAENLFAVAVTAAYPM